VNERERERGEIMMTPIGLIALARAFVDEI